LFRPGSGHYQLLHRTGSKETSRAPPISRRCPRGSRDLCYLASPNGRQRTPRVAGELAVRPSLGQLSLVGSVAVPATSLG
jgi:hypothetical protein